MKISTVFLGLIVTLLIFTENRLPAHDIEGGTVSYQATRRYDFQTLFAPFAKDYPDWLNSIPTESQGNVTLTFTQKHALYDTQTDQQVLPQQLRDAQAKAAFMQGPAIELKKAWLDLEKNELIRQVDFMGRVFLVSEVIGPRPWKLTGKTTKILNHLCMSAELVQDGKPIVAWFASEMPFPIGPDEFFGLPGLVLAVEIDGATAFLARSIELTPPSNDAVAKPKDGKKVTQEEFDIIVEEKTQEYKETKYEGKDRK